MKRKIVFWGLTILCALSIFSFSAQSATDSSAISKSITEKVLDVVSNGAEKTETERDSEMIRMHEIIRQVAHGGLFFCLGLCCYCLCNAYSLTFHTSAIISSIFCSIYALTDEWHQTFSPGRTFEGIDLLVDIASACGAILILYCIQLILKWRGRKAS